MKENQTAMMMTSLLNGSNQVNESLPHQAMEQVTELMPDPSMEPLLGLSDQATEHISDQTTEHKSELPTEDVLDLSKGPMPDQGVSLPDMPTFRRDIKFSEIKFKLFMLLIMLCGYGSDVYNGSNFVGGQYYMKYIADPSDPSIHYDCTMIDNNIQKNLSKTVDMKNHSEPEKSETKFEAVSSAKHSEQVYECFEKDKIYGYLTLGMLFLPGFFCIFEINENKSSLLKWSPYRFLLPVLYLMCIFCFPAVLIIFKILHIFLYPGNVLEHIATKFDQSKALFEDSPQLALQLYILLCEADRRPRTIQLIAIAFACLNIAIPSVKAYLLRKNILLINTETKLYWLNVLKNYLVFFLTALFRISSFSFFICLIRYNAIFIYLTFFFVIRIFFNISSILEESSGIFGVFHQLQGEGTKSLFLNFFSIHDVKRGKHVTLFYQSIWLIFYITSTIILMVLGSTHESDSSLHLFFWPSVKLVTWNELYIIKHNWLLLTTGTLAICCGIGSYLLFISTIFWGYDFVEDCMQKDEIKEDGPTPKLDNMINYEILEEGDVDGNILKHIWEPYNDRTHFEKVYKNESYTQNLKHMTLLVDPWQLASFVNRYLDKENRVDIKEHKSTDSILEELMWKFNPKNKIVSEENKDIGTEICFRANIAKEFLDKVKHAESEIGRVEEEFTKLQRIKEVEENSKEDAEVDSQEKGLIELIDQEEKEDIAFAHIYYLSRDDKEVIKKVYEERMKKERFITDCRDLTLWTNYMQALIGADELPKNVSGAEALLDRHHERKSEIDDREDIFRTTADFGQMLLESGHDSGEVKDKLIALETNKSSLLQLWEERRILYDKSMDRQLFYRDNFNYNFGSINPNDHFD